MAQGQDEVRVFISSTFRDMHAERDHLNRFVFPELRERCARLGAEFLGYDLRWGVTREEAETQGALKVCLDEIERCRPFFVCLLGDRFGWVPPPEEIPRDLFERARAGQRLAAEDAGRLDEAYRLDSISNPPVYRLRRDRKLSDAEADALARFWAAAGLPLAGESITAREILRGVFDAGYPKTHALFYLRRFDPGRHADFPPAFVPVFVESDPKRREKLEALKAQIRGRQSEMVVREYDAGYEGLRIDPALLPPELSEGDRAAVADGIVQPGELPGLSAAARSAVEAHGTVALTGMEELGTLVLEDLWRVIEVELAKPKKTPEAHEQDRARHDRFLAERTRRFYGREAELARILAYAADGEDRQPLVVTGAPGSGKSALLAEAARRYRELFPQALVVTHFIGAAPGSSDLLASVRSVCETLRRACEIAEEIPLEPDKLRGALPEFLAKAAAKEPVILFLDALNQLDPSGRSQALAWFPWVAPPGARVVASTLAGEALDRLREAVPADHVVEVPALPEEDRRRLVTEVLAARRKKLTEGQLAKLLETQARPDAGLPLYLVVAVEELCLFGDYEALEARIGRLPARLPELFAQVLARLEQDHTRGLVEQVGSALAVARSGLTEAEVLELLGEGARTFAKARWTALYRALQPYLRPVEEETGAGLLDFYHDQLRFACYRRYLEMEAPEAPRTDRYRGAHRQLAACFGRAARGEGEPPTWRAERPRALGEFVYHQTQGEMWDEVGAVLTDLLFIEARCKAGLAFELVEDYSRALEAWPGFEPYDPFRKAAECVPEPIRKSVEAVIAGRTPPTVSEESLRELTKVSSERALEEIKGTAAHEERELDGGVAGEGEWTAPERVEIFSRFVAGHVHTLRTYPEEVVTVAYNHVAGGPVARAAGAAVREGPHSSRPWLERIHRPAFIEKSVCLRTLEGHTNWVCAVALSADSRLSVSGGVDHTIRVWDVASGRCMRTLEGHTEPVRAVGLSSESRLAVSGSFDRTVRSWDLASGRCLRVLEGHTGLVSAVALSSESHLVISGSGDKTLRVWDVTSGRCLRTLEGHRASVEAVGLSADARIAVSGSRDSTVRIWDVASGRCLRTLEGHADSVYAVALSANSRVAVSGGDDKTVRVWDVASGRCLRTLEGHTSRLLAIALSVDSRVAVSGGDDKTVRVWDVASGRCLCNLEGHAGVVCGVSVCADSHLAVSGSWDKTVRVWDVASGRCVRMLEGHADSALAVALSADSRVAVSGSMDGTVRIWDAVSARCVRTLEGHRSSVFGVALSPDSRFVVSASDDKTVRIWDLRSGSCLRTLDGHVAEVRTVVVSADSRLVISGSSDYTIRAWDGASGRCLRTLDGHVFAITALAVSSDSRVIVSGSAGSDGLRVWDVTAGHCLRTLKGHTGSASAVALSTDSRLAVSGSDDRTVRIWDVATGHCLRTLQGHAYGVSAVALSPDSRFAVSASVDKTLLVWDVATGSCLCTLEGHTDSVEAVALSADSRLAVSGGVDKTVRVWDVATSRCLAIYAAPGAVRSLALLGTRVIAGDEGGQVHLLTLCNVELGPPILTAIRRGGKLRLTCPLCQGSLVVPERALGKTARTKCCGKPVAIAPTFCDADAPLPEPE